MLTETQTAADVHSLQLHVHGYTVQTIYAASAGRAGEGILLAVRQSLPYQVLDHTCDPGNGVIFIKLQLARMQQPPITVGVCYLPPQGSPQLQLRDAQSRCSSITDHITSASAQGSVVFAGDFNARVGNLSDHWAALGGGHSCSPPAQRQLLKQPRQAPHATV